MGFRSQLYMCVYFCPLLNNRRSLRGATILYTRTRCGYHPASIYSRSNTINYYYRRAARRYTLNSLNGAPLHYSPIASTDCAPSGHSMLRIIRQDRWYISSTVRHTTYIIHLLLSSLSIDTFQMRAAVYYSFYYYPAQSTHRRVLIKNAYFIISIYLVRNKHASRCVYVPACNTCV